MRILAAKVEISLFFMFHDPVILVTNFRPRVLATYSLWKNGSNTPPNPLVVIPSAAEGSRRRGLASPSGRDSSAPLRFARNDISGDFGGFDTVSAK